MKRLLMKLIIVACCRDFMGEDMNKTRLMLSYLYPLLARTDPDLKRYMDKLVVITLCQPCLQKHSSTISVKRTSIALVC